MIQINRMIRGKMVTVEAEKEKHARTALEIFKLRLAGGDTFDEATIKAQAVAKRFDVSVNIFWVDPADMR